MPIPLDVAALAILARGPARSGGEDREMVAPPGPDHSLSHLREQTGADNRLYPKALYSAAVTDQESRAPPPEKETQNTRDHHLLVQAYPLGKITEEFTAHRE